MLTRRDFVRSAALLSAALPMAASAAEAKGGPEPKTDPGPGAQRLPVEKLKEWEALAYGMFLHFGMSTYIGRELPDGRTPLSTYNPVRLDVDQWVSVARDAGMKYAVLTAKHVAGHCLWPTRYTDYSVVNSPVKTDVVEAFVTACAKRGVRPGIYYCSWDNHNRFGSMTPTDVYKLPESEQIKEPHGWAFQAFTTREYQDFQYKQMEELMTQYGPLCEFWLDIPGVLPRGFRESLYRQMAVWQPDCLTVANCGDNGQQFPVTYGWPTDVATLERTLPHSVINQPKWREIEGKTYYLPAEVCDTQKKDWFFVPNQAIRPEAEQLGMYLLSRLRGCNFLLDVPPDHSGVIPDDSVQALLRLRTAIERTGVT